MTRYSIIHKDGSETHYVWCDETKQMVTQKEMTTAVIYSNGSQECERMSNLLQNLSNVDFHEYKLDKDFTQKAFEDEFGKEATYPQVSLNTSHIGSMNETLKHMKDRGMFV